MSYAFEIKMICGGYVYFSTFTQFISFGEKHREIRKPDEVEDDKFINSIKSLGHSVFRVKDKKGLDIWLNAKGWALVDAEFMQTSMQQWLKSQECVTSPIGVYSDINIVSPKTMKRSFVGKEKLEIINRDGGKCLQCGSDKNLTMQHVVPYSFGGETTSRNLVTLCDICNQELGNIINFTHSEKAGLQHNYERSLINDNWYTLKQIRTATLISQNLMQSRCEVW